MRKSNKKLWSSILCMMLIVAMALSTVGCGKNNDNNGTVSTENVVGTESDTAKDDVTDTQVTVLGEGQTVFSFTVVDGDGKEAFFEIHTDKAMVGEALVELGLIAGEDSAYGLYVKTVNGLTLDYDTDKAYWAFYVNGEYAMSGVDTTPITEGETYMFKAEKA